MIYDRLRETRNRLRDELVRESVRACQSLLRASGKISLPFIGHYAIYNPTNGFFFVKKLGLPVREQFTAALHRGDLYLDTTLHCVVVCKNNKTYILETFLHK